MVNPTQITDFARDDRTLDFFWIFCVMVAGKNADHAARAVTDLAKAYPGDHPLRTMAIEPTVLRLRLVESRCGQYDRVQLAIAKSAHLDLRSCTLEELLAVPGVGNKTARFFLLHSRPGVHVAVLDTHIRRWMRRNGSCVPQNQINPKTYAKHEAEFLEMVDVHFPGRTIAEVDLMLWVSMSGRNAEGPAWRA